jgi:hypothetical protein
MCRHAADSCRWTRSRATAAVDLAGTSSPSTPPAQRAKVVFVIASRIYCGQTILAGCFQLASMIDNVTVQHCCRKANNVTHKLATETMASLILIGAVINRHFN